MNENAIEQEIQAKGLTAPRVTPDDVEKNIVGEFYFSAAEGVSGREALKWLDSDGCYSSQIRVMADSPLNLLTFCVLVLKNGFTVTGESACASRENFDAELGRKIARQNAVQKIWPLMGYELRTRIANGVTKGESA